MKKSYVQQHHQVVAQGEEFIAIKDWNGITPYALWTVGKDGELFWGHYFTKSDNAAFVTEIAKRLKVEFRHAAK